MSLTIEGDRLHAENINHPDDIYVYFDGGFLTWNINSEHDMYINFNGDLYVFERGKEAKEYVMEFNKWAKELIQEAQETKQLIAQRQER